MKGHVFQDAAASSTRIIGRKDVQVVFEGELAATNGNTVYLPSIPAAADVSEDDADIIRGYRDHETMHLRCTDMSKLEEIGKLAATNHTLHQFTQYCEDIRIEHAGVDAYPGMQRTFSATNKEAANILKENISEAGFSVKDAGAQCPPDRAVFIAIQTAGRKALGIDTGFYDEFVAAVDPKVRAFCDKWAAEMVKLPTGVKNGTLNSKVAKAATQKSFDLAAQIEQAFLAEWPTNQNPPPPPPPINPKPGDSKGDGPPQPGPKQPAPPEDDDGDDEDDGNPGDDTDDDADGDGDGSDGDGDEGDEDDGDEGSGDSDSDDGGDGDGDDSDSGDGGDDAKPGDGKPENGKSKDGVHSENSLEEGDPTGGQNDTGSNSSGASNAVFDTDYRAALNKIVDELETQADSQMKVDFGPNASPWREYSSKLKVKIGLQDLDEREFPRIPAPHHISNYEQVKAGIKDKAAMIRRVLELELQARFDRVWQTGHKSGRLNSVRLVDAMQGAENVYAKRETGRDIDTLLVMSIDGSGSMGGAKIARCQQLAIALSEALERTGADIEIEVWDDQLPGAAIRSKVGALNPSDVSDRYEEELLRFAEAECMKMHGMSLSDQNLTSVGTYAGRFISEVRQKREMYATLGQITRRVVKSRKQRMTDPLTRANLGAIDGLAGGGTPMVEAATWTMFDMAREKHGKKILLVLTDGMPNRSMEHASLDVHKAQMKFLHRYGEQHGVHLIGIGIQVDVSSMFHDYVNVSSTDAYTKVMSKVAAHLRDERKMVKRVA